MTTDDKAQPQPNAIESGTGSDRALNGESAEDRLTISRARRLGARVLALGPDHFRAFTLLVEKAEAGRLKHGTLCIATDPRDFKAEARSEHLDAVWYLAFQELRELEQPRITYTAPQATVRIPELSGAAFDVSDIDEPTGEWER